MLQSQFNVSNSHSNSPFEKHAISQLFSFFFKGDYGSNLALPSAQNVAEPLIASWKSEKLDKLSKFPNFTHFKMIPMPSEQSDEEKCHTKNPIPNLPSSYCLSKNLFL